MATDYDAPRSRVEDELDADSLEGLKAAETSYSGMDEDGEIIEAFAPPANEVSGEEFTGTFVPRQDNEFTCASCFIVQKKNRLSHEDTDGSKICLDCA